LPTPSNSLVIMAQMGLWGLIPAYNEASVIYY